MLSQACKPSWIVFFNELDCPRYRFSKIRRVIIDIDENDALDLADFVLLMQQLFALSCELLDARQHNVRPNATEVSYRHREQAVLELKRF
jgi:hypothetical protein